MDRHLPRVPKIAPCSVKRDMGPLPPPFPDPCCGGAHAGAPHVERPASDVPDLCCPIPGLGISPAQILALAPMVRTFLQEFTEGIARERYAAAALTGLLAKADPRDSKKLYVRMALELADEMMALRKAARS